MEQKSFMRAAEIMEVLGVSDGMAYRIIRELNRELEAKGFHTVHGCFLHNVITKSCRAKWRMLHLQNGESCRGYGGKYSGS